MGLKIVYSKIARQDLKEIYDYIRRDSYHYAKQEEKSIRSVIKKLKAAPTLGKKFEKSDDEFIRSFFK